MGRLTRFFWQLDIRHLAREANHGNRTALIEAMACGTPSPRDAKVATKRPGSVADGIERKALLPTNGLGH